MVLTREEVDEVVAVRALLRSGEARRLREAAQLSRAELAARVGVHEVTLAKWECGSRVPRPASALALGGALIEVLDVSAAMDGGCR